MIERKLVRLFSFYSFLSTVTTELLTSLIKKSNGCFFSIFADIFTIFWDLLQIFIYRKEIFSKCLILEGQELNLKHATSTDSTWEVQKSAERKEDEVYSK